MPLEDEPLEEAGYDRPAPARDTTGMRSYDPADVQPTSPRPAPSSSAPGFGDTLGADVTESGQQDQQDPEQDQQQPLPEFDPRWRDEFRGLTFLGALSDEFEWLGHRFKIRTLTTGELAEVALIAKPYAESEAALKAWQPAPVAACVVTVDGQDLVVPLTSEVNDTHVRAKFRYVMDKWFPPVLDVIYTRYIGLEYTAREVLEAMGKASG